MADKIRYYDSPFTFIDPIRVFKANDPYYFEIDNIPLKQLEESQKFLRDQIDGIITDSDNLNLEIDRSGFSELKPFVTGSDRKVRVKPGRYTARINDAYTLTPLQVITQIGGLDDPTVMNTYQTDTANGSVAASVLDIFQQGINGAALNMNGLAERAFVFPIDTLDGTSTDGGPDLLNVVTNNYRAFDIDFDPNERPLYPNVIGALFESASPNLTRNLTLLRNVFTNDPNNPQSGSEQGRVESDFIKRWRGAVRTSVVDVAEELEVTVPDFDENDFYYIDSDGLRTNLNCTQRLDLLFVYSKPVDAESTTISKFDANGNPTTITTPTLGILKGAGIGLSREAGTTGSEADDRINLQSLDGIPVMLSHPGDISGNNGFTVSGGRIRGSFPSPDDLMNLAPVLSENLESTSLALIGQSIFPVAYIRVRSAAGGGPITNIISNEDIIDIRPFFRTTELTYNERAGIAAATPQVSIANPVVTEAYVDAADKRVFKSLSDRITTIESSITTTVTTGGTTTTTTTPPTSLGGGGGGSNTGSRTIATGNVLGGFYGPEGALMRLAKANAGGGLLTVPLNQLADLIESEFGYPNGSIPYLPNWDKANWYKRGQFTGNKICDHINIAAPWLVEHITANNLGKFLPPWISQPGGGAVTTVAEIAAASTNRFAMYQWGGPESDFPIVAEGNPTPELADMNQLTLASLNSRYAQINFVSKRINLNLENTPWVKDYHVKVNLLNCTPLSEGKKSSENESGFRNSSNVWVQKHKDYFVICVAWAGSNVGTSQTGTSVNDLFPWADRDNPEKFAGFAQPQMQLKVGGSFVTNAAESAGESFSRASGIREAYFNLLANNGVDPTAANFAKPQYFNAAASLLYPSVQWEVVGVGPDALSNAFGPSGNKMSFNDPTVICN